MSKEDKRKIIINSSGFTLVEMLIAMVISVIIMAAVMTSFRTQHKVYLAQDEVVEMQQNLRVAFDLIVKDLHSAGYNPDGIGGIKGITDAKASAFTFTRDDGAGAVETVSYSLVDAYASVSRNDGLVDDLAREINGGGFQPLAENISNIEFRYLDEDGNVTADLDEIVSVQLSMMVQVAHQDLSSPVPAKKYTTPGGATWTSTAGYRSNFLTSIIQCRNLGI